MTQDDAFRIEHDTMGEVRVPRDALYSAQTQRAVENFAISGTRISRHHIAALAQIKRAAALTNAELGVLDAEVGDAIAAAAEQVIAGDHDAHFPIDVFQTGSGTSSNMNANEVIARLAGDVLGSAVHPNDHVNMSQSSNDVIPTGVRVSAAIAIHDELLPALARLQKSLGKKADATRTIVKTGRTHLMDAMPVTMGQELDGWAAQIGSSTDRLCDTMTRLTEIAQGGTAVGTGINAHPKFGKKVAVLLTEHTGAWQFDLATETFSTIPGFPDAENIKSLNLAADGQYLYTVPEESWWTYHVSLHQPAQRLAFQDRANKCAIHYINGF